MASKTKMPIEQFIPLYLAAHKAGLTKEEFAKKIGVSPITVYQRVYELNREGLGLPILGAKPKMSLIDRAKAAMQAAGTSTAEPKGKAKAAAKVVEPKVEVEEADEVEPQDELEQLLNG
jgi:hypothetical protein